MDLRDELLRMAMNCKHNGKVEGDPALCPQCREAIQAHLVRKRGYVAMFDAIPVDEVGKTLGMVKKSILANEGLGADEVPKAKIENSMLCPHCHKGIAHYTISTFNGHVWCKCLTCSMSWGE
ncbi:hypothetical protein DRO66_02410 [Candidatus Bathyarchaeota archaeon]|nr:MAG: hypothetical protein DRO66_02410 [Candidatus Bathyarchaeota archaeon]